MNTPQLLQEQRQHLASLLEAIQRFVGYSATTFAIDPLNPDFAQEFAQITGQPPAPY